jgi:hypothetical protein
MKLTVIALGVFSDEWPEIKIWVDDICHGHGLVQGVSEIDFEITLPNPKNCLRIDYVNKKEHHTKIVDGIVVADQSLTLQQIRFDDILCDTWMLTDGLYRPRYFPGFLERCPAAAEVLPSQLIWHFPGSFILPELPTEQCFWDWYRDQRYEHMHQYQGKDWHREEKYIGSREMHRDLLDKIKELIRV